MVARRSATGERTQTINQARALIVTGPDDLRARFATHTAAALVADLASLRPRPGSTVGYATRIALRELGLRAEFFDAQLERLDELILPLVTAHAPGLLALYGVGPHTAALLLIAAGDHPERLRSEAAWAHMCAAAPIPASSGKTTRHRLNPGGNRQAGHALWRIVFTRMGSAPGRPAPTSSAAREKENPSRRSSAASSVTSPARSTPAFAPPRADALSPGAAWPANRLPHSCWPANDSPAVPGPIWPAGRDLIRACPPPGAALPCLVRNPSHPSEHRSQTPEFEVGKTYLGPLTRHRSIVRRGQGLIALRFMLTSSSQQDYCPAVARDQIAKGVLNQDGHPARQRLGRRNRSLGLPALPAVHGHQGPWPGLPARIPAPAAA